MARVMAFGLIATGVLLVGSTSLYAVVSEPTRVSSDGFMLAYIGGMALSLVGLMWLFVANR